MTATWMIISVLGLGAMSPTDILDGADARIQEHRTAEVVVRVLDAEGKPLPADTEVRIEQTNHAFLFGCNIFSLDRFKTAEENEAYATHFAELLNFATLPFYWWAYEPEPDRPGHDRIVHLAQWCKEHNVQVKGHPLAWNYVDPKWLPQDVELARTLQMARIFRETAHFKDTLGIWDVVNEATAYDRAECLKNAPMTTRIIREAGVGPYLRQAFRAARAANPQATLIINDYREGEDYASKVLNELVDEQGKPMYDVIGIQSHQHGGAWSVQHTWEVCERFKRYGKPLHFTETTFVSGKQGWGLADADPAFKWESTPEGEQRQADDAERFYTVLFSHPAVEAITWWDFADGMAWQRAPAGMMDEKMQPKPVYHRLKGLIKGKWWTQTTTTLDEGGQARFRGFFGTYRITLGTGDAARVAEFSLGRSMQGPIEVRLR